MGIFDRIRKFFSRSESSRTNRASNRVVQRSYQAESCPHFNVLTSRARSSNVIERSSVDVLHRSNTDSITRQVSSRSHGQPDANLKRTNSCNATTLSLSRDTVYLPEYAKKSNTAASVSKLPRLKCSNELKDDSEISIANNCRRKYPRPNDFEVVSAEYNITSFRESKRKAASDLNSMQSTPKPKPTSNRKILSSAGNIDNVNHQLDFWQTRKCISTESKNTENKSSVEKNRSNTSKDPKPITSQAKIVHSMSYRTPAISHQEVLLNKNHMIQTLSNTNTSAIDCSYPPYKIERKLPVHNQGVGKSGKTRQHTTAFSRTETSSSSKTSIIDRSFTPHKIESTLLDHNQRVGNTQPQQQQTTTFSKTETPGVSQTSAFSFSNTQHKIESPKVSDHNWGIRETFGNLQQSATLNKTNTTQIYRVSNASAVVPPMTSYKRYSAAVPDHRSVRIDELERKGISCRTSTIPQLTRTYVDVDKVVKAPRASILRPPSVFHSDEESTKRTPLSSHTNVVPVPVQFPPNTGKSQLKFNTDTKPLYSLQNFTLKLQTPMKDKSFEPQNVIYHNQWTKCSAQIHVDNDHLVRSLQTVDVSSKCPHVDFRDTKIEKGHLYFTMKCCATQNISILIKTNKFELIKDFDVIFSPCSSYLSEMKIEKFCPEEDKFVFRAFIFDVFGEPVPSNSSANYHLDASSQSKKNVVRTVEHIDQGQICYDITVRGERPWSQDLVVLLNGKQISHPREFEFTEECQAINDIDDEDYEWIRRFFDNDDCGITIPLTTGGDDGKFVTYNENNCKLQSQNVINQKLICNNVRKCQILGEDCAHINNIKRVLDLKDRIEVQETDDCAIIVLRNVQTHLHPVCKEVVQHLVRGLYYRRKASEAARVRMEWKNRLICIDEVLWLDRKSPSFVFCKYFKDFFGDLINKYNREACDELFKFFNFQRDESEVDLHGLFVADEKTLKSLRLNLLIGSLSEKQIKKILEICKIFSKQGRLRQTLRKKFRTGKVPEKLVKLFIEGGRRDMNDKSLNELEHECSDEDCCLCFGYYMGHDDDYDDDYDDDDFDDDDYDDDDFDDDDYDDDDYDDDDFDDDDYEDNDDDNEEDYNDGDYDDDDDDDDGENWQSSRNPKRSRFLSNKSELSRGNDQRDDVDSIIRRCRQESDEAIRKLEKKLDKFNLKKAIKNNTPWLEIIVGAGRHSKNNKQNIRPKVEKLLKERNHKFAAVNKGSLVVTFKPYCGPEPCFGEYFCEKCDRCWKSSKSFVKKYQKRASCKANCWPVKQREKEKFTNYCRDGYVKRQSKPHQSSLCQRCQELGRPCNEDDNYDSDSDY